MKQKLLHKLGSSIALSAWLFAMLAGFLNFGFVPTASAACTYRITRFDAQQSATREGTLNVQVAVTRSGSSGECADTVRVNLEEKLASRSFPLVQKDLNFNNTNTASGSITYPLRQIMWSELANQNQLPLQARVYAGGVNVTTSSIWTVNISGSSGTPASSGAKAVNVTFSRATYNSGETVDVNIKVANPTGAPDVDIVTTVNGKVVGSNFSQTGANLAATQVQKVVVNSNNGFRNGLNDVKVQMFEKGSNRSILYAEGSGQVGAQGLPASTTNPTQTGTPGSGTPTGGAGTGGTGTGTKLDECTGPNPDPTKCVYNPLPTDELITMFLLIAKGFFVIIGVVAVVFVIIGGFKMVISQGNSEAVENARNTITYAILGVVVAMLSFAIVQIVQNFVHADIRGEPSQFIQQNQR